MSVTSRRAIVVLAIVAGVLSGQHTPVDAAEQPTTDEPTTLWSAVDGSGMQTAATVAPDAQTAVRQIIFPLVGANTYSDTFGACRSGCSRGHEGTDIMAAKLTRLVAARDARVSWLKNTATPDGSQGNYLMLRDAEGWEYWYIHINNDSPGTDDGKNPKEWIFAPGIEVGTEVHAGQHVGYVGDSGNAEGTAPHLHFEIHKPDGSVINPYKSLNAAPRLTEPVTSYEAIAGTAQAKFVQALHEDFLDRPAEQFEIIAGVGALSTRTRQSLVHGFATSDEWIRALIDSYYESTLGRPADDAGHRYWTDVLRRGTSTPAAVAAYFYAGDEYYRRAGGTDRAWLSDLYRELLRRAPDAGGIDYWIETMRGGAARADVASWFYGSLESRKVRVRNLYVALLGRTPDASGHAYWAGVLTNGRDIELAEFLASSDEYYRRAGKRTFG